MQAPASFAQLVDRARSIGRNLHATSQVDYMLSEPLPEHIHRKLMNDTHLSEHLLHRGGMKGTF